jgi:2-keto-4-pentenoate hydratase/2-oxohepta-3-ene-1,7-dioic acid hydratase in catechol pathway
MKQYIKFSKNKKICFGIIENDKIHHLSGTPLDKYHLTSEVSSFSEVNILPPIVPGKIIAIGLNYRDHLNHIGERPEPKNPEPFLITPSAIIGPNTPIILPQGASQVEEEAELVVIIGRKCRNVPVKNAKDYIFGYTCGNDVSARHWQKNDLQWTRAKSSDTFSPIGPYITTGINPDSLDIKCRVNGKTVQDSNTKYLIHSVSNIIEFISSFMTLEKGDLIFTGTPGQPVEINPGDKIEVEIEHLGILTNPVSK